MIAKQVDELAKKFKEMGIISVIIASYDVNT